MTEIIAKETGMDFPVLPVANYQAVCFDVWDIGIQKSIYEGRVSVAKKIVIGWEVDERDPRGKRQRLCGWYTLSLGKKANLRRDLTSWRGREFTTEELKGKGFDMNTLVGANCMLNVIHKEDGKPKVSAVTAMPKNLPKIAPETPREIPEWIKKFQDKAITEEEATALQAEAEEVAVATTDEADIPF